MRTGTVSYKLEDLKKGVIIPIGFVGENDFTRVIFDAEEIYKKYPNASVSMKVQPPKGGIYPATVTRDGNTVIWQVKEADVANRGGGELQLTFTDGETKIKTYIAKTDVKRSLAGNGTAPDPVQDWIDDADEKLAEVEQALDDLAAMDNIAKTAQASDIGKALSPKTVENGVVTEWEYITPGGGTEDYTDLDNKPSIAGVTLSGNKTLEDLGIAAADDLDNLADDVTDVKNEIHGITPDAQQSDIGKALILKTIDQTGKPTAFEYGEAGGGSVDPSVVEQKVNAWLSANITNPDSPPLDRSLSSGSAAAPADLLGAVSQLEGTQKTETLSPFKQGAISESTGVIDETIDTYCYFGKVDVKAGDSVTYTRYNSKITYTAYIAKYNASGQFISRDSFLPDTTVTFAADGQFAIMCGRNNATLEEAIDSASRSFSATITDESDIVKKVNGIDKQIEEAEAEVYSTLLPQIVGIKNYSEMTDNAKSVIKSVVLYDADLSKVYTLGAIQKSDSTLQIVIYRMTSQMTQDVIVSRFLTDNYNGQKTVHLNEVTNSGISADIAVDFSEVSAINETGKIYVIDPSAIRIIRQVETQNVLLPDNIYLRNTQNPMQLFPKNLLKHRGKISNEFTSNWYGYSYCQQLGEEVVNLSYSNAGADMEVKLNIADGLSGKANTIGVKTVHVNPVSAGSNFSKKILCIGDSFFDYPWYTSEVSGTKTGKGIMSMLDALASDDGNTLDFIGTHLSYTDDTTPYYSESYGGWMESWFVSSDKHGYEGNEIYSPFYINSTPCNFSAYFTNLGETPDIVLFFLGMNGNFTADTGEGIADMIEAIQTVSPTTKCLVCTIPPYYNARYLYNYSYIAADIDKYNCNNKYLTLFDGQENNGIYVCPINAVYCAEYHYIQTEVSWLNYSDRKTNVVTNHHPNQIGVKVIADAVYSVICGMFA